MKKLKHPLKLIFFIVLCHVAGILGSIFTAMNIQTWYTELYKPWFTPPAWIFGPVWFILYTLMGIAIFLVYEKRVLLRRKEKHLAIAFFWAQLLLNTIWSPIFFGLQDPMLAFFEIIILLIVLILTIFFFTKIEKKAAFLLFPYLIWACFAATLNAGIWLMN